MFVGLMGSQQLPRQSFIVRSAGTVFDTALIYVYAVIENVHSDHLRRVVNYLASNLISLFLSSRQMEHFQHLHKFVFLIYCIKTKKIFIYQILA